MVSLKSSTQPHGTQPHNPSLSRLTPFLLNPPHPHPGTTFFMILSSPFHKGTGLAYQITTTTTTHFTLYYHSSTPPKSEKSTTISLGFITKDQTLIGPKHTLFSTFTSTHPKQRGTLCRLLNSVPPTSLGKESATTSPKHTTSLTSPMSVLARAMTNQPHQRPLQATPMQRFLRRPC